MDFLLTVRNANKQIYLSTGKSPVLFALMIGYLSEPIIFLILRSVMFLSTGSAFMNSYKDNTTI